MLCSTINISDGTLYNIQIRTQYRFEMKSLTSDFSNMKQITFLPVINGRGVEIEINEEREKMMIFYS